MGFEIDFIINIQAKNSFVLKFLIFNLSQCVN
jgi:hypothetical protein